MATKPKTTRVITSIENTVLKDVDKLVEAGTYSSRSHWLRQAARAYKNGKSDNPEESK